MQANIMFFIMKTCFKWERVMIHIKNKLVLWHTTLILIWTFLIQNIWCIKIRKSFWKNVLVLIHWYAYTYVRKVKKDYLKNKLPCFDLVCFMCILLKILRVELCFDDRSDGHNEAGRPGELVSEPWAVCWPGLLPQHLLQSVRSPTHNHTPNHHK